MNCEEKRQAHWANRHILGQIKHEEKNAKLSFQSTDKESMVKKLSLYHSIRLLYGQSFSSTVFVLLLVQ